MLTGAIGAGFALLIVQAQSSSGDLTPEQLHDIAMEALKRPVSAGQSVVGTVVPLAFFAAIVVIFWLVFRQRQARIQARTELHKHLLDKFGSGHEFSEFLESKGSQRFLEELFSQRNGTQQRILDSMRNGIVLSLLGLGMLGLSLTRRGFLVPSVLALALGIGFLISMALSYRLSKQWDQHQKANPENASVS